MSMATGFLGTERQFNTKYSRPIIASRGSATSANVSRENQEAAALAMEALHRQVRNYFCYALDKIKRPTARANLWSWIPRLRLLSFW